ncbi:MAG: 2-amino-4-hydroxy-6-hydroxymethyldihydropteridine diphosphokinase [Planctomycetes bacterium]|nr:2-amino-4-hydroxy-6-hydroxymethyldihydropteridine diphosphokinase [Planctomycetota bacterium]
MHRSGTARKTQTVAYVGLGSNLGDRQANLDEALRRLGLVPGVRVLRRSTVRETDPVGLEEQPRFLNAVAEIACAPEPEELLGHLLRIEAEMGRVRRRRWGPRPIDLDLLLFGRGEVRSERLTVPHPRLAERGFVLEPLAELCPARRVPGTGRTVRGLLHHLSGIAEDRR